MTNASLSASTLTQRDKAAYLDKGTSSVADLIVHAARKSGRSALSFGMEMMKFAHGKAKLQNLE